MSSLIHNEFHRIKDTINQKLGERAALKRKQSEVATRLDDIESDVDSHEKASLFLQTLSDTTRQMIIDKISTIVTDALQKVLDKNLAFEMRLSTERNQVDIKFLVKDKYLNKSYDILNSFGGGMADIITFPLRVSLLLKWSPSLSRILIMDETFKAVDKTNQELMGEFIRQLSEKLNMQIILVTHSPELTSKAHKKFKVSQLKGISTVSEQ